MLNLTKNPNWKIIYDTFSWWLEKDNFHQYAEDLSEDLLQIENLHENYLIDVGWYPMGNPNGNFIIKAIKDVNWEQPVITFSCKTPNQVIENLEKTMKEIDTKLKFN